MQYECPSCGSPIEFKRSTSVYASCTYCSSTVVKHDTDLELIGKQSDLIKDLSPFQVGTRGKYKGDEFELLGRIKLIYPGGMWSEWYAWFQSGKEGWISAAQGFYMISFEAEIPKMEGLINLKPGEKVEILDEAYEVDDIKVIRYAASEGELPFRFEQDYKGLSVDLRGRKRKFANILEGQDGQHFYLGEYLPFDEFEFDNLKKINGWP